MTLLYMFRLSKEKISKTTKSQRFDFGVNEIRRNPTRTFFIIFKRYLEVIYPSHFMEGVSLRYIGFDSFVTFILTGGIIFSIIFSHNQRLHMTFLLLISLSIYTIVTLYQREWDLRVQLSAHIPLIIALPLGWRLLYKNLFNYRDWFKFINS